MIFFKIEFYETFEISKCILTGGQLRLVQKSGNCFLTKSEAEAARARAVNALHNLERFFPQDRFKNVKRPDDGESYFFLDDELDVRESSISDERRFYSKSYFFERAANFNAFCTFNDALRASRVLRRAISPQFGSMVQSGARIPCRVSTAIDFFRIAEREKWFAEYATEKKNYENAREILRRARRDAKLAVELAITVELGKQFVLDAQKLHSEILSEYKNVCAEILKK